MLKKIFIISAMLFNQSVMAQLLIVQKLESVLSDRVHFTLSGYRESAKIEWVFSEDHNYLTQMKLIPSWICQGADCDLSHANQLTQPNKLYYINAREYIDENNNNHLDANELRTDFMNVQYVNGNIINSFMFRQ